MSPQGPRRPNVVVILTDDHAAHAIGAYGSRVNSTPHLDRLAAEGVRMDAAYCTNSICSPSRATILTGTYSHVNGVSSIWTHWDYRLRTFPQALREQGYATALFGKWHLGEIAESLPREFDDWLIFPGQGEYWDPVMIDADGERTVPGYATDIVTDLSIRWLRERDPSRPFCLLVHHKAPHRPWDPHPRHADRYADGAIPEPATLLDDHATRSRAVRRVRMSLADDLSADDLRTTLPAELRGDDQREARARWTYQHYMRRYLQTVQAVDDGVGLLLDALDEEGIADDTIIVYTSDQGFFLGDHGWFDKRLMFDPSLQMPMLIRWPAEIPAGTVCDAMVTNVDVAATLLDACGVEASALPRSQGRSFRALLRGEAVDDWPRAIYYRYWEHDDPIHRAPGHYGVRTRDHKLICYYGAGLGVPGASDATHEPEWELYDLRADPDELVNRYDDPRYADVQERLTATLAELQAHYRDEPYRGPETPRPRWGPYDEADLARAREYARTIRDAHAGDDPTVSARV